MILAIVIFFGGLALVELLWFAGMYFLGRVTERAFDAGYLRASIDQAEETVRQMERANEHVNLKITANTFQDAQRRIARRGLQ